MLPEQVIVTIRTTDGEVQEDYQLPATLPIQQLMPLLRDVLAKRHPQSMGLWKKVRLYMSGYPLNEEKTLADHGIWDGSILIVKEEKT